MAQSNSSSYFTHPIDNWNDLGLQSSSRLYTPVWQLHKLQKTKNLGDGKVTVTDTSPSLCSAWSCWAYLVLLSVSFSLCSYQDPAPRPQPNSSDPSCQSTVQTRPLFLNISSGQNKSCPFFSKYCKVPALGVLSAQWIWQSKSASHSNELCCILWNHCRVYPSPFYISEASDKCIWIYAATSGTWVLKHWQKS